MSMYEYITKLLPKRVQNSYKELLRYNGIRISYEKYLGFLLIFGIGISFLAGFGTMILLSLPFSVMLYIIPIIYIIFEIMCYGWLVIAADSKAKLVEGILPDTLQIMSMNLKAGMTTDKALLLSARPEFGKLYDELRKAGKKVLAGTSVREAMIEMPKGIKSKLFENTINLIVEGIERGGELSELLIRTSEDIQNKKILEEETHSSVMMYAIFIIFAVGIGAPLLFGISTFLVEALSKQFTQFTAELPTTAGLKLGQGTIKVSGNFLYLFSLLALGITSFFGGLIIGIVKTGSEKGGLKLVPILLILSFVVFFMVRIFVGNILSV